MTIRATFWGVLSAGLILLKLAGLVALSWWWIVGIIVGVPILYVIGLFLLFVVVWSWANNANKPSYR